MKPAPRVWFALVLIALAPLAFAQSGDAKKEPPKALVSIYHVATGKHLEFLKWIAAREAVDKEAGVPATQLYAHTEGEGWDYIAIGPVLTDEQSKKVDAAATKKGLSTGFKANIEFRTMIANHSDTNAIGPVSAADLVAAATGK